MNCSKRYLGLPNGPNPVQSHEVDSGTKQKPNHPGNVCQFGYSGRGLPHRSLDGRFAFAVADSEDAFVKDSIDLGEARLINIRTGSFFGRIYDPHKAKSPDLRTRKYNADQGLRSSPGCQPEIPPGSTLEDYIYRNSGASPPSDKAAVQQAQQQRGNNQKPINLALPSVELDPVLALLEDDVDQLDRFRNQFRDEGVRSHKKPVVPGKGFSSPRAFEKPEIRTDDKESLNGQVDQSDSENLTQVRLHFNAEDLNETSKGLNNQINELIELEFRPRTGLTAVNQKSATLQPPNHATADQAKSELHSVDLVGGETKKLTKHLLRDHPFRWPLFKNRVLLSAVGTEAYNDQPGSSEKNKAVLDSAKIPKPDGTQRPTPPPTNNTYLHPEDTSASLSTTAAAPCLPTAECSGLSSQDNTFTIPATVQTTHFGISRSFAGPIFGQSLCAWTRRVGYPFPPCISNMLEHLQQVGHMAPGIFRRAGGRLRIQALRDCLEKDINWNYFADWQPYDVADVVKQYFRELPECLLTNKLSANLIHIYSHSKETNLSLLRWAIISLPDENRIALQSLLYCLNGLANRSNVTQMGPNNLAICFTPTLFHLSKYPRRRRWGNNANGNDLRELDEQNAAQKCLCAMINNAPDLFMISEETLTKCHLDVDTTDIPALSRIISGGDLNSWLQGEVASLIKESAENKSRSGWTALSKEALKSYIDNSGAGEDLLGFEIAFKLPAKKPGVMGYGGYLRTWRCSLIISGVGVSEVFDRFWNHRASWDETVLRLEVLEQLSDDVQVQRLLFDERAPQPARECRLLRGSLHDPKTGVIAIVSQSVNHGTVMPDAPPELLPTAHFFKEHTLLEPLHQGTSCCITVVSQVDLKGFSTDWYANHWGHFLLRRLLALRHSFTVDSVNCANQTTPAAEQERQTPNK
ncbi:Dynein light chain Tctex-type [Sparganum proliferum]